jgi:hypothetical protein
MKVDDAVETITRFFNDLIGTLVPGAVLLVGLAVMHFGPTRIEEAAKFSETTTVALVILGLMFAVGHLLLALFEHVLQPLLEKCRLTKKFDVEGAKARQSYIEFLKTLEVLPGAADKTQAEKSPWDFYDLRSVAFSVTAEGASIGRRFMFISLLCNGVGTAFVLILIDFLLCHFFAHQLLFAYVEAAHWLLQATLLLLGAYALFKRGEVFYARAMRTPFSIAIAELKLKRVANGLN